MEIVPEPGLGLGVRARVDLQGKKSIKFELFLKSFSWNCSGSILYVKSIYANPFTQTIYANPFNTSK